MAPAATTPVAEQQGPHPSYIQVAKPYLFEQRVTNQILGTGSNPQREDSARLEGVEWIDEVRRALQLYVWMRRAQTQSNSSRPVRTYNTACIYYHKFRLVHKDSDYVHINAAAAALFSACKIEDTLKKSKEILCAAYNLRMSSPGSYVTPDDPVSSKPCHA
jgi:CTD kinase subunit beta